MTDPYPIRDPKLVNPNLTQTPNCPDPISQTPTEISQIQIAADPMILTRPDPNLNRMTRLPVLSYCI